MFVHRKRFYRMNECRRQKLCICFEQNSVFTFYEECFLWREQKRTKIQISYCAVKQQNKMFLYELWKCLTWPYFVRNQKLTFLKFGHLKNYWFNFYLSWKQSRQSLSTGKLPNQLPLQPREMYYYNYISLNPIAQLSGQSYKHRKRGLRTPSAWLTWGLWMKVICFPGSWVRLCLAS